MAITNYLVHFKTKTTYDSTVASNPLRNDAVAFIQDATIIRTHGTDYHCGSGPVALKSELSTVATTGSYNDLTDKPESSETLIIDISNVDFTPGDTTSGTLTGFTFDELRNTITNNGVIILKQDGANIFAGYKQTSTIPEKYTVFYIDSTAKNYIEISSDLSYQAITLPEQLTDLGITATATELNYVDGVTSNIQTQLNGKAALIDLPEDSENVYLLDLTALGNLGVSSIEKNIGTNAYTNLVNAINNKQLVCISVLIMTLNTIIPTIAGIDDSGTISIIYSNMESEYNFTISSDGNCSYAYTEDSISANKVTGLADVATSGSYNDLSDKPEIPDVSELATKSELSNYLPLTGGTLTGVLTLNGDSSSGNVIELDNDNVQSFNIVSDGKDVNIKAINTSLSVTSKGVVISGDTSSLITLNGSAKSQRIYSTSSISIVSGLTSLRLESDSGLVTINDSVILTEDNYSNYITTTDTKNTAGSSNSVSKLFLIGASSQSPTGVQTYSNSDIYMQDGNLLLKNGDLSVSNSGTLFGGKLNIRSGIFLVNSEQVTFNPAGSDTFSLYYNDGISLTLNDSIGSFTVNGGVGNFSDKVNAVNGFYETSDARLKNFKDDIKALDVISEIPTKYFTWKKDESDDPKLHIGTSAQEIQKVYPDLVTENEEGELLVDYARLSVIALAAIKELKKEIEELKFIKNGGRED